MKRLVLLICGFMLVQSSYVYAQDNKDRGNTDKTNNRTVSDRNDNKENTEKKTPVKIIEFLPGSWTMEQVLRGGKDISKTDTVAQDQVLEFDREGRYMSYSQNEKIDSGAYRANEQLGFLYMQSETDDKTHEWSVSFSPEGTMVLKLRDGHPHGENFSYVYRRTSNVARRNDQ